MNTHRPCQLVEEFHDGMLTADSSQAFVEHLADCAECQAELESLRKLDGDVAAAWQQVELQDSAVELATSERSVFWSNVAVWRVAAAIVVLASIALVVWQRMDRPAMTDLPDSPTTLPPLTEPIDRQQTVAPVATIESRPMFAVATFPDNAFAEVVDSTPELTIYSVIPKNTYSRSTEEPR